MNDWLTSMLNTLDAAGQSHITGRAHGLPEEEAVVFLGPLRGLDIPTLCEAANEGGTPPTRERTASISPPISVDRIVEGPLTGAESEALEAGEALLHAGKVGIVVVAGGMGTRLGWEGPKGTFPIGPVTKRSLFQIFAEQIQALSSTYGHTIPWAVQTSPGNHDETCAYFEDADFLGLPRDSIQIFPQGVLPAFDTDGKIALLEDGNIVALPDGHGGVYQAMRKEGVLSHFKGLGVETVFYFQVDNPLGPIGDPRFLGHHVLTKSEMSTLIIPKSHPDERVGVLAHVDGSLQVIEYTEIDDTLAAERNSDGRLRLRAANTGIHAFELSFLERISQENALPLHLAPKPIPAGTTEEPEAKKTHGLKLEYFVFDALPLAKDPLVYEAPRDQAFAPVKSAEGRDTPEHAQAALGAFYRDLLSRVGVEIPDERPVEINALLYYDPNALLAAFQASEEGDHPLLLQPDHGTNG